MLSTVTAVPSLMLLAWLQARGRFEETARGRGEG
jgi:hypothetical protein